MSTGPTAEQVREKVRAEWTARETAAAWRKWHSKLTQQTEEVTTALVRAARIAPGMHVLDLACGSGEPALTIAEMIGPAGRVTATDLSPAMLEVAEEHARQRRLENLVFRQADAEKLPFADEASDRVTCRFGAMFFPDVSQAFREIRRVLRPNGRTSLLTWGAFDQPFFGLTAGVILRYAKPPPRPPGGPAVDRFAERGTLGTALEEAGFRDVSEEHLALRGVWPGPPEEVWSAFSEIAAPFREMIAGLSESDRKKAVGEVLDGLRRHSNGKTVEYPLQVVVGSGVR
jgi:SAM-dependent methyltransferase